MILISLSIILVQAILVFLISTLLFDIVHYALHQSMRSKFFLFKAIGHIHNTHHRFFPADLQIKPQLANANLIQHVFFEYLIEVLGIVLCLFWFPPIPVFLAFLFASGLFLSTCYYRGVDLHHTSFSLLPPYRGGLFVSAAYHALHHVYPNRYYSGFIKLLDYLLGTGQHLAGKQITMTGANGALGSNMKRLLEKEGAIVSTCQFGKDYDYNNYEKLNPLLEKTDILFLCHGTKYENTQQANCDSFVALIELFKKTRKRDMLPPEIWGVGSEIECHPYFGIKKLKPYVTSKRNYARFAHQYFHARDIQYRHFVHSAFTSRMGPGLMSASFAAWVTLFLIKRGFKYIPVTYTGFAYINYLRFVLKI